MSVQDVAAAFTEALRAGDYEKAESFWAEDVVSIENMDGPMKEVRGRDAVHGKGEWWFANHEVHDTKIEGPFVNGDQFALKMWMDLTPKEGGQRRTMDEVCLYTVRDGKIAEERFFY